MYAQPIVVLDEGVDVNAAFLQVQKKNASMNNVTKGKIASQVKELTQESFDAFIYSAVTNAIIGIAFVLLFSYLRRKYKHIYYPRFTHCYSGRQTKLVQPNPGFFGWFGGILAVTDEEIFTHVGLDILALLKIFIFCLQLFSICCVYNLGLLMFGYGKYSSIASSTARARRRRLTYISTKAYIPYRKYATGMSNFGGTCPPST